MEWHSSAQEGLTTKPACDCMGGQWPDTALLLSKNGQVWMHPVCRPSCCLR